MSTNFHLEPINIESSFQEDKYKSQTCQEVITATKDLYKKMGVYPPWIGYLVINENVVVGAAGFNGKPLNNSIEISYFTFPEFEGKGFASLVCKELINLVKNENPSLVICAKTAPEENASTSILKRNGFEFQRVVQDHEIGDAWLWELIS
jgi:RimJ/RimL family protein N-acetyltransferase